MQTKHHQQRCARPAIAATSCCAPACCGKIHAKQKPFPRIAPTCKMCTSESFIKGRAQRESLLPRTGEPYPQPQGVPALTTCHCNSEKEIEEEAAAAVEAANGAEAEAGEAISPKPKREEHVGTPLLRRFSDCESQKRSPVAVARRPHNGLGDRRSTPDDARKRPPRRQRPPQAGVGVEGW